MLTMEKVLINAINLKKSQMSFYGHSSSAFIAKKNVMKKKEFHFSAFIFTKTLFNQSKTKVQPD